MGYQITGIQKQLPVTKDLYRIGEKMHVERKKPIFSFLNFQNLRDNIFQ